ncbi:MAG: carboxypeptidase-like regulatory domain-containing protein [Planctomycetota bacterium]
MNPKQTIILVGVALLALIAWTLHSRSGADPASVARSEEERETSAREAGRAPDPSPETARATKRNDTAGSPADPRLDVISLRFIDSDDGMAVAGVMIGRPPHGVVADEQGIASIPRGRLPLTARHDAYGPVWLSTERIDAARDETSEGRPIDIALQRARRIGGRVVDQDGIGIAEAEVVLSVGAVEADAVVSSDGESAHFDAVGTLVGFSRVARTDTSGEFRLFLPTGAKGILRARRPGYLLSAPTDAVAVDPDAPEHLLPMVRLYACVTVLRSSCGRPEAHHAAHLMSNVGEIPSLDEVASGTNILTLMALGDRLLETIGLSSREALVEIRGARPGSNLGGADVVVERGSRAVWGETVDAAYRFVPLDRFAREHVGVVDVGADCPGHARLSVRCPLPVIAWRDPGGTGEIIEETASGEGDLQRFELIAGRYRISLSGLSSLVDASARSANLELRPGEDRVLDLSEAAKGVRRLRVGISDSAGRPVSNATLRIQRVGGRGAALLGVGSSEISLLATAGRYRLVLIDSAGQVATTREVDVDDGAEPLTVSLNFGDG